MADSEEKRSGSPLPAASMSATDEKSPGAASPKTLASTATDTVTETPVAAAPAPAAAAAASSTATKQSLWDRLYAKLPPWFTKALYNKRQWKNLVRTLIAFFAMCILMVCNKSLVAIGPASFFGLITICMLTPAMPLSIFMFVGLTVGLGMCVGWAWGCASMASGLRARSSSRFEAQLAAERARYDPNVSFEDQFKKSMFAGAFLDPRSSAVMGVFLFFGTYGMAWLRAKKPKMALFAVFGTIILDLMSTFGPLFPMAQYSVGKNLVIPGAVGMALGLASTVLIFPQTLNHLVLNGFVLGGLGPIQGLLKMQDDVLKTDPDSHAAWGGLAKKAYALRKGFMAATTQLSASSRMLHLEVSRGRISAGQLQLLIAKSRDLGTRAFGLASFVVMVEERHQGIKRYEDNPLPHHTKKVKEEATQAFEAEKSSGHSLKDLLPELGASTAELRQAAQAALGGASAWLGQINNTRWKKTPADAPTLEDRDALRERLIAVLAEYRKSKHFSLLERYRGKFDANGNLIPAPEHEISSSVYGLFRCFILTSSLIAFCQSLIEFLEFVRVIEVANPQNKLQFPGKFVQTVVENATDSTTGVTGYDDTVNDPLADDDSDDDRAAQLAKDDQKSESSADLKKRKYARDPDARDPTNNFQKFGRLMSRIVKGMTGPNGIYALRYGLVSIAIWTPSVCHHSAKFYFENRGLWALIMAQTGLGVVTGEQIYNVISRVSGTCIGVVTGMVVWYIGAQKGTGNPYGVVAATMVAMVPFLFCRLACPPQRIAFWMLTSVTVAFTVGYSWVDNNIEESANQGAGASLAGRRALLVIIGFAAGTIMALLPKPVSAKSLVREGLCKNIGGLGELYGLEVTAFERSRDEPDFNIEERRSRYRERFLKIFGRFSSIEHHIQFAGMEPAMRGKWPQENYKELLHVQSIMLAASAALSSAYSGMNTEWIQRLTDGADVMHPSFTADCFSLFTILRHSLRNKVPLPPTIPIFERLMQYRRSRRSNHVVSAMHSRFNLLSGQADASSISVGGASLKLRSGGLNVSHLTPSRPDTPLDLDADDDDDDDDDDDGDDGNEMLTADKALWDTFRPVITWESIHDEQFAVFATALISLMNIVSGLNTMHSVILDLVGERELEGFDLAQERWAAMDRA